MRQIKLMLCAVAILLGMGAVAWAEGDVSYEVTADFFSKYVWRGQNVTDDWVLQPGVSATYNGFTGGVWGNLDLTNEEDQSGEFIEYDLYLEYGGQITDLVGYSVGGIFYNFPSGDDTLEFYAGVSVDTIASPSLTVYWDVEEADGLYATVGVEHSIDNFPDLPFGIDLAANIGWGDSGYNAYYWDVDDNELNALTLSAAFPFQAGPVTVTPSVHYVNILGSEVSDEANSDDNLIYAGVGAAYSF